MNKKLINAKKKHHKNIQRMKAKRRALRAKARPKPA